MKKHVCVRIIVLIVLLVLACVPMHVYMSDGGSEGWYAILWQYTKYHEMLGVDEGWRVGPQVTLLGFIPIYDGTQIVADEEETFSELSKLYHVSEINQAIAVIKKEFEPNWAKDDRWSGCTLREIEYAGDEITEKDMEYYLGEREQGRLEAWGDFDQVIILTSTLDVDETGGDGSFVPDQSYTGWKWILVRSKGGPWRHVDHGYG